MPKFAKGLYTPKNPVKYIGKKTPVFRSGWERTVFMFFDNHPSVLQWASEPFSIRYFDPVTEKVRNYWPDLFAIYIDKNGTKHAELIEVKPVNQTGVTRNRHAQAAILRNHAKWKAALEYCSKNGITFRVVTENDIFGKAV